ncbi:MAG: NADH-ubiquinone oxidoreductase-F iron-sulfur binding region domain-containing protein, partial [Dehalococcoidia bacterium]
MKSRAALQTGPGRELIVDEIDLPDPGPGQALVKLFSSGICLSQIHQIEHAREFPQVFGHEAAGVVTGVGAGVTHLREGDHAIVTWVPRTPISGRPVRVEPGVTHRGEPVIGAIYAWAEDVLIQAEYVIAIGKDHPTDVSCIVGCAVLTGAGAVKNTARVRPGDSVVVFGVGGVGLCAVQMASILGAYPVIAAYAMGASRGFIYVRAEYPIAVEHVAIALEQARERGFLGEDILGSGFDFDIDLRMGAGAFVCGEETALIASLEGDRGMPNPRPPFPTEKGYQDKPTCINNVETFANVPLIVLNGEDWYRGIGTEGSPGTKIFALAGRVNNTGLVEVPMGATLRTMIYEVGGGIPNNRPFKAAQLGGPSGGCLPMQYLDLPIDYDSVKEAGAIMGSGGLIVMDESTCMVNIARYFLEFTQDESCGKCVPCRVGTRHMLDILNRISCGEGKMEDLDELEQLAEHIQSASLCGLGQSAPNPVLTTLRYFRAEYEEHIQRKHCRASVCEALVNAPCSHACPAQVNVPQYVGMIAQGQLNAAVDVIRRRNPFVSVCGRVCDHPCQARCRRGELDDPLAIRALKRYAADNATGLPQTVAPPTSGTPEVAIIGAGPGGLSCAYFLALMGRHTVVFEKQTVAGGMLALGIPEYRLPKEALQKDIDFILRHGVELRTDTPVESVEDLKQKGYRAVFLATGAQDGRGMGIDGEDLEGVEDSLEFLRARGLGLQPECGKQVAVIGGGNAAVDAARSAIRLGAEKVRILYRRTREEMPAYDEEIEEALLEGIELHELVAPNRIIGENGKAKGIEMTRMELGKPDDSGRRRPVPIEGSEFIVEC